MKRHEIKVWHTVLMAGGIIVSSILKQMIDTTRKNADEGWLFTLEEYKNAKILGIVE